MVWGRCRCPTSPTAVHFPHIVTEAEVVPIVAAGRVVKVEEAPPVPLHEVVVVIIVVVLVTATERYGRVPLDKVIWR